MLGTREELQKIDQRTRKLMTIHKTLLPKPGIDRMSVSRNEGGKGLASIQASMHGYND